MNRMHHSDFLAIISNVYKPKTYVELGLYVGETMEKVLPNVIGSAYGVDLQPRPSLDALAAKGVNIKYMTTDQFFETHPGLGIDMAFIDADHCATSALRDFENCLKQLNPGGVIFMHDTDPREDRLIHPGYCGDSYKVVSILEKRNDINITTFPLTEAGLSMITRKGDTRTARRGTV